MQFDSIFLANSIARNFELLQKLKIGISTDVRESGDEIDHFSEASDNTVALEEGIKVLYKMERMKSIVLEVRTRVPARDTRVIYCQSLSRGKCGDTNEKKGDV